MEAWHEVFLVRTDYWKMSLAGVWEIIMEAVRVQWGTELRNKEKVKTTSLKHKPMLHHH